MQRYANLSGESGVLAFELGRGSITVEFSDGWCYVYDEQSAGAANVVRMREFAEVGIGLCTFISRSVRQRYARKFYCRDA